MSDLKMHFVFPDLHVPGHNVPFLQAALKSLYINRDRIESVILPGDFLDCKSLSSHDKGMVAGDTLGDEFFKGNMVLDLIDEALGKGNKVQKKFLFGNHEDRWNRFMMVAENSKLGGALLTIEEGLHLFQRNYIVRNNWKEDYFQVGDYQIWHGIYTNKYAASKHIEEFKSNIIFGHTHRLDMRSDGKYIGYNLGFMGDVNHSLFSYATYSSRLKWINMFAVLYEYEGKVSVSPILWNKNHFILEGKLYK